MSSRITLAALTLLSLGLAGCITTPGAPGQAGWPVHGVDEPGYVQHWLLCGPFPNPPREEGVEAASGLDQDYLAPAGGEDSPTLSPFLPVAWEDEPRPWMPHAAPEEVVDLDEAVSPEDNLVCYAGCVLRAPEAGRYTLAVGSNNGIRLWLNGRVVLDEPDVLSYSRDGMWAPVELAAGDNLLLAKVAEVQGSWQLSVRVKPYDVADYARGDAFRVKTDADGAVRLHAVGTPGALPFEAASFTLARQDQPSRPLAAWDWAGEAVTPLPVDGKIEGAYRLDGVVAYPGGVTKETRITFHTGTPRAHVLFENGESPYSIIVPRRAQAGETWAAHELARVLEAVGGAALPVRTETAVVPARAIWLGATEHGDALLASAGQALPREPESLLVHSVGPHLILRGADERGTIYAMLAFLEQHLGCRWYTSQTEVLPKRGRFAFDAIHHRDAPAIPFRCVDYFDLYDGPMATRSRTNSQRFVRGEQPGGQDRFWFEHSFERLIPPHEFFESKPEYFSLIHGERVAERSQLCLSNPEVLPLMIERLRGFIQANPDYRVFHVAQNDNQNYCRCEGCTQIAEAHGGQGGLMLWFVNQVAQALEPEFPEAIIGTFAYQYTRGAPKNIVPRDNVMVVLCSIECDFSHPFSHPNNASFLDDVKAWTAITPQVFIWDYVVNFAHYLLPHPNFGVLQENIQILHEHGVLGILEQANCQCRGTEFDGLRAYVLSRLLWNPDADVDRLVDDFITGYHGKAAPYVRRFHDATQALVHPHSYLAFTGPAADSYFLGAGEKPKASFFTNAYVEQSRQLREQALAAAESPEHRRRVETVFMPLLLLELSRDVHGAARQGILDEFIRLTHREEVTFPSEGFKREDYLNYWKNLANPTTNKETP